MSLAMSGRILLVACIWMYHHFPEAQLHGVPKMPAKRVILLIFVSLLTATSFGCQDKHLCASDKSRSEEDHMQTWLRYIERTSDPLPPFSLESDFPRVMNATLPTIVFIAKPAIILVVSQDGTGHYRRIQEAVDAVRSWSKKRTVIHIKAGVYSEKVTIPRKKTHLSLIGESGSTIIEWNSTASDLGMNGKPLSTLRSATVAVSAEYFVAKNIIFKNTAPSRGAQAVALRISGDKAAFYNCTFLGYQDTLYDHRGRHYFKNCRIEGSVDFIFGSGRSLYQGCQLYASTQGVVGFLTAQKRSLGSLNTGFSFVNSTISGSGAVYLGRAWGNDSRVVFSYTFMDDIVIPEGWSNWGIPAREKSVFYAEYECYGPGADRSRRVRWARSLTPEEARPFLTIAFINGKKWVEEL
ncbi:hypothetical protein O6H91_02G070200 [Diphasiastrum complanatum]|uniref:Uncharacterized protein n=1 Tax=Diphasiastrum complanatum TaxID=34168 RepID=A0ACC2EH02_DIPCM|nr:hypothetical protein O6H91_02G070200 [Diphasiastrum complanatum]